MRHAISSSSAGSQAYHQLLQGPHAVGNVRCLNIASTSLHSSNGNHRSQIPRSLSGAHQRQDHPIHLTLLLKGTVETHSPVRLKTRNFLPGTMRSYRWKNVLA